MKGLVRKKKTAKWNFVAPEHECDVHNKDGTNIGIKHRANKIITGFVLPILLCDILSGTLCHTKFRLTNV